MTERPTITKKVPKLRFRGFSNEWEVINFYDVLEKVLDFRGRTPLKLGMQWGGNISSLSALNVKMGYIDFTLDPHKGSEELYRKWMVKGALAKDDILFTMEAPLGNVALVPDDKKYILSQRVMALKIKKDISNHFIYQLMRSDGFQNRVENLSTGSTAKGINQRSLQKVKISKPDYEEQEKIAGFLGAVDNKISDLENKKELLEKYKKGAMQAIFSQKIRFKGFSEKWEEKRLGDIAYSEASPLSANNIKGRSGDYKVYGASGVLQTLDSYHYEDEYIAIVKDGAGVGRIIFCEPKSSVLGTLIVVQPNAGTDKRFLFYLMRQIDFNKYITGSTIPHVYFKQYSKDKINVPSYEEQQRIAGCLTVLDDKIDLTERQLEQAKLFKKALLQQMFV